MAATTAETTLIQVNTQNAECSISILQNFQSPRRFALLKNYLNVGKLRAALNLTVPASRLTLSPKGLLRALSLLRRTVSSVGFQPW
jgi:hypothetical protein